MTKVNPPDLHQTVVGMFLIIKIMNFKEIHAFSLFMKSVCFFFKFIIFEDERSLVDIDQLPNISFRFFIKWAQLFFFIGPESNHCLPLSLTRSLTD